MKNRIISLLSVAIIACSTVFAAEGDVPVEWHNLKSYPLLGTLAPDASVPYSRFPDSMKEIGRAHV